jgi:hypothetical protein
MWIWWVRIRIRIQIRNTAGNTTMVHTGSISLKAVLRIRDPYPGSRVLIFSHPRSRILDPTKPPKRMAKNKLFYPTFS